MACVLLWAGAAQAQHRSDFTFFEGTQYPLDVTFIDGDEPGPTVMVQGGIQGDEPSGFVTAELLAGARVTRGRLIVVPRANVPSINLARRQVNVDMNRRFDKDYNRFYEDRVARVIRHLLRQSDAFIHLHEGSGFYNPTYVDRLRNPKRYGQSIIVDTLAYDTVQLEPTVTSVLHEVNAHISSEDYRFRLFNTRTFDPGTPYPEMRKSLTCYALSEHKIPAVAVEVSKDIRQLDWKVGRQMEATLLLLRSFGVHASVPDAGADDSLPAAGAGLTVNGRRLARGETLHVAPGSTLAVEEGPAGSDAPRSSVAVFASDRPGVNLLTAQRMVLEPFTGLELRVDGRQVQTTDVRWTGPMPESPGVDATVFVCWLNGRPTFVRAGQVLRAVVGDQLILEGVWGSRAREVLNLKGYVAQPWDNDGQDMGWEIILDPENFLDRYRVDGAAPGVARYRVVRETRGARRDEFYVDVAPRQVHALRLADARGHTLVVPWVAGGDYPLQAGDYTLLSTWSNGADDKLLLSTGERPIRSGERFSVGLGSPVEFTLRLATTFAGMGSMTFHASGLASADAPALN